MEGEYHLIVAHEVTDSDSDLAQLANMVRGGPAVRKRETGTLASRLDYRIKCTQEPRAFTKDGDGNLAADVRTAGGRRTIDAVIVRTRRQMAISCFR
ncbi:hypothetical protein XH92_17535 [Bradyrhizobium sp. CCBAU 53421]|nr:hypothetical protein XH92_17535 [Bradyrhizobium sp. CCBAU 53421]